MKFTKFKLRNRIDPDTGETVKNSLVELVAAFVKNKIVKAFLVGIITLTVHFISTPDTYTQTFAAALSEVAKAITQ